MCHAADPSGFLHHCCHHEFLQFHHRSGDTGSVPSDSGTGGKHWIVCLRPVCLYGTGGQSSAISPFSSGGSLILGSTPKEEDRNTLFNKLLLRAVPVSVLVAAAYNFIVAFVL